MIGTRDVITFTGRTPLELRKAFQESVDDYLAFCKQLGESPEKPFSGKFVARLAPDLHRRVSQMAGSEGKSLNQFVSDCLEKVAEEKSRKRPSRRSLSSKSIKRNGRGKATR